MQDFGRSAKRDIAEPNGFRSSADVRAVLLEKQAIDFFAESLADLGRVFGGDIRGAAIIVLLARQALVVGPGNGLTQTEIAAAIGIPRESVRRKLTAMERLGWLGRRDTVWYIDTDLAEAEGAGKFAALRARFVQRASELGENIAAEL